MVIYVKGRNNNGPFKSDPKFTETKKKKLSPQKRTRVFVKASAETEL